MISDYVYLNTKTFEIDTKEDIVAVVESMANVLSILNKKGYYTEICSKPNISKPNLLGTIIHELIKEKLLEVNNDTKGKIKNILYPLDSESILIIFKEEYKFDDLPLGYKMSGKDLFYYLSALKDDDIIFKSAMELDEEYKNSLKLLEDWASKLPSRI